MPQYFSELHVNVIYVCGTICVGYLSEWVRKSSWHEYITRIWQRVPMVKILGESVLVDSSERILGGLSR